MYLLVLIQTQSTAYPSKCSTSDLTQPIETVIIGSGLWVYGWCLSP